MAEKVTDRSRSRREKSARRTSLVFGAQQDDNGVEVNTVDELIAWIQAEHETAWRLLFKRQGQIDELRIAQEKKDLEHASETMHLREQLAALEDRMTPAGPDMEEEYARLRTELDDTRKEMAALRSERDSLMTVMRLMGLSVANPNQITDDRGSPAPSQLGGKRSTKMPDPAMFSDGKLVKFDDWMTDMKRKLLLNEDHYPTDAHQLAYVSSRCEGKALRHVQPRMKQGATEAYQTAEDVFDHLGSIFLDPNRRRMAQDQYIALKMDPKQGFNDFLSEFTYLADEADQPKGMRKDDLYRKLPTLLQNQVMADAGEDSVTLSQFVRKCQVTSRLISQQIISRAENRSRNPNRTDTNAPSRNRNDPQTPKPSTRLDDKEKAALLKEGRCFVCREQGHISRNCPTKNQTTAAAAATEATGKDRKEKRKEDLSTAEESDSGKE
ncbi:uncharacterized protein N7458_000939 [Penicillium daleae]|uniref:CCHC-type domain-containing protein n=1 Tax=Penicillium daleae TaxID=63821 RepID=A0AAD6G7W8_9EURO|nr:uncharacterized protein N7458_000939 [Penicillium daleae]KAJ5465253.1 hypothetical protein N7458_000939 [Penicillium daleae]